MKRLLCSLIAFGIAGTCLFTNVSAQSINTITYEQYEENLLSTNLMFHNFDTYYYDSTLKDCVYPDYYAGVETLSNGEAAFYLTDISNSVKESVAEICGSDDISFIEVTYSFNDLLEALNAFTENNELWDQLGIKAASICIPENKINVYVDSSAVVAYNENLLPNIDPDLIQMLPYISQDVVVETTSPEDVSAYTVLEPVMSANTNENDATASPYVATTIQAGQMGGTSSSKGTIGFCATDIDGEKILITHGHGLTRNASYYTVNKSNNAVINQIGTVTSIYHPGTESMDAAVIHLNSDVTLTNTLYGRTSKKLAYTITHSGLLSKSGSTAYVNRGKTGSESSGKIAYYADGSTYTLYIRDANTIGGDSGSPVYIKTTTSNYTLIGIVKGESQQSMGTVAISLPSIRNQYDFDVYGATLS